MALLDWVIVAAYFIFSFAIGVYFYRRAGKNTSEFFLGGRNFPWWLAGLSMVATTFAADTPLAVTELVAQNGIAGNWLWWNMAIGGMLTALFFARMWRRSGVMTDLEFIELRYSGKSAAFLRGFRSIYLGLFFNTIILGWVNVALATILEGMFDIPAETAFWYIVAAMLVTAFYSSLSGLWGVAVTDAVQFIIAMAGCLILAIVVINDPAIGGLSGLAAKLPEQTLNVLPSISSISEGMTGVLTLSAGSFIAYIGVQWWASWYPGAEPGGGGYIAQRMLSAKDERHSFLATLFFQIAHYCLRPWPWILVALASLILFPALSPEDVKLGYIYAIRDYLPTGLKGLLIAAFFAAYMSTIATHLNWGTSYIVHDFWKRFVRPDKDEKYYVLVSRITTILLMACAALVTSFIDTISGAWQFLIECGAGMGLVLILRWFWWRINAWSEITATAVPILVYAAILIYNNMLAEPANSIVFPNTLFVIVFITSISWIAITYLTRPTDEETLKKFYTLIRPFPFLWKPIARHFPEIEYKKGSFTAAILGWLSGILIIYSVLFLVKSVLFDGLAESMLWFAVCTIGVIVFLVSLRHNQSSETR
jgi:solute:Na+ symporter, SSS family